MRTLTREQAARIDRYATKQHGISGLVLMENAGRATSDLLCALQANSPIVVCCGKGNNAGDGYVIARHLLARNYDVHVLNWESPEKISGDARTNYLILRSLGIPVIEYQEGSSKTFSRILSEACWIVDALLGTGCKGAPRNPIQYAIEAINQTTANTLAVDIPSGMDCDYGATSEAIIRADHTCTFMAAKIGLIAPASKPYVGEIHVADLGIPASMIQAVLEQ